MSEPATKSDVVLCSLFDAQIKEIIAGKIALPNVAEFVGDIGAAILYFRNMHAGAALMPDGKKEWNARFFLDYGQGGAFHGSGIVAWTAWSNEAQAMRAVAVRFSICDHNQVEGAGANHSRGWHPSRCTKCGLDMSVDSGD
jgi:hypothetical protein